MSKGTTSKNSRPTRPIVGTMIGDPAGIGPEVIARALATGQVHACSIPVLIGSSAVMERAVEMTGVPSHIRAVQSLDQLSDDPGVIDILDSGALPSTDLPFAEDTARAGTAMVQWLNEMDALARGGAIAATVMGPVSSGSFKLAQKVPKIVSPTLGESYLVLFSGPLRVAHLTDHMPLSEVGAVLTPELVARALQQIDEAMKNWGMAQRRIVVAGLNPHATGYEDINAIAPGVSQAQAEGIDAVGPVSPDAVFRQCIDGQYDMVLAMYHDQGHIAIKTWGFSGNCAIILGPPHLFVTVAHGTAYDIVGKGTADPTMMLSAMRTAAFLATGSGFPKES